MRINALVAKAQCRPRDGWTMADGSLWPGNKRSDHESMIQVRVTGTRLLLHVPVWWRRLKVADWLLPAGVLMCTASASEADGRFVCWFN